FFGGRGTDSLELKICFLGKLVSQANPIEGANQPVISEDLDGGRPQQQLDHIRSILGSYGDDPYGLMNLYYLTFPVHVFLQPIVDSVAPDAILYHLGTQVCGNAVEERLDGVVVLLLSGY